MCQIQNLPLFFFFIFHYRKSLFHFICSLFLEMSFRNLQNLLIFSYSSIGNPNLFNPLPFVFTKCVLSEFTKFITSTFSYFVIGNSGLIQFLAVCFKKCSFWKKKKKFFFLFFFFFVSTNGNRGLFSFFKFFKMCPFQNLLYFQFFYISLSGIVVSLNFL